MFDRFQDRVHEKKIEDEIFEIRDPKAPLCYDKYNVIQQKACKLEDSLKSRYRLRDAQEKRRPKMKNRERKEKDITVQTQEDYDIDKVLEELGEDKPKENKQRKKKKKSKRKANEGSENPSNSSTVIESIEELNIGSTPTNDPVLEEQERLATLTPSLQPTNSKGDNMDKKEVENTKLEENLNKPEEECSICFSPRIKTFLFFPCGHATFCEPCANCIFNELRKCPTCQTPIQGKCPVFH